MSPILSLLLLITLFGLSFLVFLKIPFKKKRYKIIFISILAIFMVVMMFVPSSAICSIHLPIINSTIHDYAAELLSKSEDFNAINEFSGGLYDDLLPLVEDVVKGAFVFIVVSISLMLGAIVSFIAHLFFKKKQLLKTSLFTTLTMILSIIILIVPIFNVYVMADTMEKQLAREGERIYETHPAYEEYKDLFDLLAKVGILETETIVDDISLGIFSAYTRGSSSTVIKDLNSINWMIREFDGTGVDVLFTNETFTFAQTNKDTFDFNKIHRLVDMALESGIYDDVVLSFANSLLGHVEKFVEVDILENQAPFKLQFTMEEMKIYHDDLLNMVEFVIENGLIHLANLTFDELKSGVSSVIELNFKGIWQAIVGVVGNLKALVGVLGDNKDDLKEILESGFFKTIVGKLKRVLPEVNLLEFVYMFCGKVFESLDLWLADYKETKMYETADRFLQIKGVY